MEIESRVERLEQELKFIKNEIQQTLLDIQEQVLVHYYPTLRAEEERHLDASRFSQSRMTARQLSPDKRKNGDSGLNTLAALDLDDILMDKEEPEFKQASVNGNSGRNGSRVD